MKRTVNLRINTSTSQVLVGEGLCQFGNNGFLSVYNFLVPDDFNLEDSTTLNCLIKMVESQNLEDKELNIKRILFSKKFKKIL